MDSRGVIARFDAERQALALMDHPNIARIYDGGLTPAGQPFFVMELVQGVPLTEYCDAHQVPRDEQQTRRAGGVSPLSVIVGSLRAGGVSPLSVIVGSG
jgi:serine/threonine protein kinase